jgi:hypothetical protein
VKRWFFRSLFHRMGIGRPRLHNLRKQLGDSVLLLIVALAFIPAPILPWLTHTNSLHCVLASVPATKQTATTTSASSFIRISYLSPFPIFARFLVNAAIWELF